MKVTYIRLENVAGLVVGSNKSVIEIDFSKSINKIIAIAGVNGAGKSVLLSSISPFAGVTALDERSSLPYIIPKKNGYKEIHYQNGDDEFIIKHYYKASKDTHTIKSYFQLNGEELNENGNVTSFLSLVEIHMGLTQEMMRLIRLGTNVNSIISLTPARRKEYIGKLIDEIDMYLKVYKKITDDIRVLKVLMNSNSTNLYNCHISDIIIEEGNLDNINKRIKDLEKKRDQIVAKISKIVSLMNENNIDELKHKRQEAESSLIEFDKVDSQIKELSLENTTVDQLMQKRNNLSDKRIDVQSKINSYRISIDNNLRNIEKLELSIKRVTSNNDIQSLMSSIETLRSNIDNTNNIIKSFTPLGSNSNEVYKLLNALISFNQISQMIYTLGSKSIDIYLKLKKEKRSIDTFLKDQSKKAINRMNESDLQSLFDQVFQNDDIISPNCDSEYINCPYYRLSETINRIKDKVDEENYDSETLRGIQIISNNIDNILNELDRMRNINIPDSVKDILTEKSILSRLALKVQFFDITGLQDYLSILKEYEIYKDNISRLSEMENQLSLYKKSGIDSQLSEIKELNDNIAFYKNNIITLTNELSNISKDLDNVDKSIGLLTKYLDSKKYRKMFESTLESTNKILIPLENASNEKIELDFELRELNNDISRNREESKSLENKINEYKRLLKEGDELNKKYKDLSYIQEAVSTKKGIPVIYMKKYLGKIQKTANNLLKLIYDDNLQLGKFKVDNETFEIPYIKNGTKISDVKYSSQSELSLMTMALSFALANNATGIYNILLLDEIDAGLDENNRSAFLKMLYMQMNALNAEQVFIISHNLTQMINIPMDVIKMTDIDMKSKLQNIIYE